MQSSMAQIAPLIEQVDRLCRGHEQGDKGAAAAAMLAWLDRSWPEVPRMSLPGGSLDERDPERLVLGIVLAVGELAGMLLEEDDPERAFGWARANLTLEAERYVSAVRS